MYSMHEKFAYHPGEALYLIGFSRSIESGKKTAANLSWRRRYPLPLTCLAGKKVVLATDIEAAIMSAAHADSPTTSKPSVRPRGRPRSAIAVRPKQFATVKQEPPRSSYQRAADAGAPPEPPTAAAADATRAARGAA
jgi:hypothetical protein